MAISKARKQEVAEAILETYVDPWKWIKDFSDFDPRMWSSDVRDLLEGSTPPHRLAVQIKLVQEELLHYKGFHATRWEIRASLPILHAIYGFMLLGRTLNE